MSRAGWSLLAVIAPLLVLRWAAVALIIPPKPAGGLSLDGALSPEAAAMAEKLAAAEPEVLVVGNSLVDDIDLDQLLAQTGQPDRPGLALSVSGTSAPHWYAWLKNRVFAAGHRPEVIVIAGLPRTFLRTRVTGAGRWAKLNAHLTADEPVIARLLGGSEPAQLGWIDRVQASQGALQATGQEALRDWSVGLLLAEGPPTESIPERGQAHAVPALDRMFGAAAAISMDRHRRVIPIIETPDAQEDAPEAVLTLADTFIPPILQLAEAHSAQLIFLWLPTADPAAGLNGVPQPLLAELEDALAAADVPLLDLHALDVPPGMFHDAVHLNRYGRPWFTRILAGELEGIEAFMAE